MSAKPANMAEFRDRLLARGRLIAAERGPRARFVSTKRHSRDGFRSTRLMLSHNEMIARIATPGDAESDTRRC